MRTKLIKTLAAGGSAVTALIAFSSKVAAQTYYTSSVDDAAGSAFFCGYGLFTVCLGLFSLVAFAFSIWMLIDALQRDEKVLPGKVKWALVIFFLSPIGGIVYYFTRKKKLDAMK
jgi:hypothetical protein